MSWRKKCVVVVGIFGLVLSSSVMTAQPETKSSITICDFEKGIPKHWKLQNGSGNAELEKNGDNTVLELGKHAIMTMGDEKLLNFSIEATVRREFDTFPRLLV